MTIFPTIYKYFKNNKNKQHSAVHNKSNKMYLNGKLICISTGLSQEFYHVANKKQILKNIHFSGSGNLKIFIYKNSIEEVAILFTGSNSRNAFYPYPIEAKKGDRISFKLQNLDCVSFDGYVNFEVK